MGVRNSVAPVTLRSRSAAIFGVNFALINANGLTQPCFLIVINNASDRAVFISFDGVTEHEFLAAGQVLQLYAQNNAQPQNHVALWPSDTKLWVKASAGAGAGAIYVSGYYQPS